MPRYRRQRSNPMDVLDNPRIFGADVRESVDGVAGIVLTAMLNDKLLSPLTRRFVSGWKTANNTVGQLIDAGTTLFGAQLVGMLGSRVLGAPSGRRMAEAGGLYGMAKVATAFVPNLSVSAQYPDFFPGLNLFNTTAAGPVGGMQTGATAALAAGAAAPGANYFTANPRPVAADADVGY